MLGSSCKSAKDVPYHEEIDISVAEIEEDGPGGLPTPPIVLALHQDCSYSDVKRLI